MKINIINKLPFIVVTGLNFSTILLTLLKKLNNYRIKIPLTVNNN